jgi:hypothetical protein
LVHRLIFSYGLDWLAICSTLRRRSCCSLDERLNQAARQYLSVAMAQNTLKPTDAMRVDTNNRIKGTSSPYLFSGSQQTTAPTRFWHGRGPVVTTNYHAHTFLPSFLTSLPNSVVVTLPLAPMPHVDVASESVLDLHPAASVFPLLLLTSLQHPRFTSCPRTPEYLVMPNHPSSKLQATLPSNAPVIHLTRSALP